MPKELGYWDYVKAAFNAKPAIRGLGSVPVNKLGLLAVGLLGGAAMLVAPPIGGAVWLLGGAVELGYLYSVSGNRRFQALARRQETYGQERSAEQKKGELLQELSDKGKARYLALEQHCLELQSKAGSGASLGAGMNELHLSGLSQLLWIFLRLTASGESLRGYLASGAHKQIVHQIRGLETELKGDDLDGRVRKSKESTLDILQRRYDRLKSAAKQVKFIDSELERIEQQIALLKEESLLNRDPDFLSDRIDGVTNTLGETNEWMRTNAELISNLDAGPSPEVMLAALKA